MTDEKIRLHPADLVADLQLASGSGQSDVSDHGTVHAAMHTLMSAAGAAMRALSTCDEGLVARHLAALIYATYGVGCGLTVDIDEALIEWHAACMAHAAAAPEEVLMTDYASFLAGKDRRTQSHGELVEPAQIHPFLHPWQVDAVSWAVRRGRAGLFTTTGTGKTVMQLEWGRLSGDTTLVLAPLAVCQQTVREGAEHLDLEVSYIRSGEQLTGPGVWITNYEMAERFDPRVLDAVVLDEGSILRDSTGATRTRLIELFARVPAG